MSVADHLPLSWTIIATRRRRCGKGEILTWIDEPGAMITMEWAWRLLDRGEVLLACRHEKDCVQLLVRPRLAPPPADDRKHMTVAALNGRSGGRTKRLDAADVSA